MRHKVPYWLEATIAEWEKMRPRTVQEDRNLPGGLKVCSKCGETKPVDDYNWYTARNGNRRRMPRCKACKVVEAYAWNTRNPKQFAAANLASHKRRRRRIKARTYGLTAIELSALEAAA